MTPPPVGCPAARPGGSRVRRCVPAASGSRRARSIPSWACRRRPRKVIQTRIAARGTTAQRRSRAEQQAGGQGQPAQDQPRDRHAAVPALRQKPGQGAGRGHGPGEGPERRPGQALPQAGSGEQSKESSQPVQTLTGCSVAGDSRRDESCAGPVGGRRSHHPGGGGHAAVPPWTRGGRARALACGPPSACAANTSTWRW